MDYLSIRHDMIFAAFSTLLIALDSISESQVDSIAIRSIEGYDATRVYFMVMIAALDSTMLFSNSSKTGCD